MPYEEYVVERIERVLREKKVHFTTQKMMGGVVFLVNEKMLCATSIHKQHGVSTLMCRVGENIAATEETKEYVEPMIFGERSMKDFIYVLPDGYDIDSDLEYYIDLSLDFNPKAKKSKKKK